jgi:putative PIN family toxin of toxin-antitoxin system
MTAPARVVFDCSTFLQALASPRGPAGRCVQLAIEGKVNLFISPYVLEELREVTSRPKVIVQLRLVTNRVEEFFEAVEIAATLLDGFPEVFTYHRDPDDAHYVNLALAAQAKLIVSRDRDLLDLMDRGREPGADFAVRFPQLRILDPVRFLLEVDVAT